MQAAFTVQTLPCRPAEIIGLFIPSVVAVPQTHHIHCPPGPLHPNIVPHFATGGLRRDDIDNKVPEALQWEDEGGHKVEREFEAVGMNKRPHTINRGRDLQRSPSLVLICSHDATSKLKMGQSEEIIPM